MLAFAVGNKKSVSKDVSVACVWGCAMCVEVWDSGRKKCGHASSNIVQVDLARWPNKLSPPQGEYL